VAVEKKNGVSFFCKKFLEGRLHVRGSIVMVETTGGMPVNVAILFSHSFL
jgi:hypothetical protein